MRLSDIKEGSFWMEQHGRLSWTVVVLAPEGEVGRWKVFISNSLGRQFVTHWNDWERSPISRELR